MTATSHRQRIGNRLLSWLLSICPVLDSRIVGLFDQSREDTCHFCSSKVDGKILIDSASGSWLIVCFLFALASVYCVQAMMLSCSSKSKKLFLMNSGSRIRQACRERRAIGDVDPHQLQSYQPLCQSGKSHAWRCRKKKQ